MAADERKTAIRAAVSVVGLGAMGSAVAGAFLEAGHPTTVWNRSSGKADPLVENGAVRAATVGEAFGASPLVLLCVLNDSAARETLAPLRTHAPLMDDLIDGWRARGAPVDRLRQVRDLVDRRVAEGRGEEGFSSLIEAIRERSASA
jgi:prephenate dehydrogenase